MEEIFFQIKNKTMLRRVVGISMILLGFVLYLVPLIPSYWAIIIGLEILGIRFLVLDKLKVWMKDKKFFKKK